MRPQYAPNGDIPQPDSVIRAAGDRLGAIGTEVGTGDSAYVTLKLQEFATILDFPDAS
jgi:hypothetical protein